MDQTILNIISGGFNNRIFSNTVQYKGVRKFRSKQFGCKNRLDLLTVDVLYGF